MKGEPMIKGSKEQKFYREVIFKRGGRYRRWRSLVGNSHKEEVYDVYGEDGKRFYRGLCVGFVKKELGLSLKKGESKRFLFEEI